MLSDDGNTVLRAALENEECAKPSLLREDRSETILALDSPIIPLEVRRI